MEDKFGWAGSEEGIVKTIINGDITGFSETTVTPIPEAFELFQNFPNPFNPSTTIKYSVPNNGRVRIRIYNNLGQAVRLLVDEFNSIGERTVIWDGKDNDGRKVATGVYYYQLEMENSFSTKRMILVR